MDIAQIQYTLGQMARLSEPSLDAGKHERWVTLASKVRPYLQDLVQNMLDAGILTAQDCDMVAYGKEVVVVEGHVLHIQQEQ